MATSLFSCSVVFDVHLYVESGQSLPARPVATFHIITNHMIVVRMLFFCCCNSKTLLTIALLPFNKRLNNFRYRVQRIRRAFFQ